MRAANMAATSIIISKVKQKSPKISKLKIYKKSPNISKPQISRAPVFSYDKNSFLSDFNAFVCDKKDFITIT
jgi:hypothetical protein